MDYLRAFTIGTSGLVTLNHMSLLSLVDKNYYDYSSKVYSLVAPIYYGLMTMLALYFRKKYKLSLSTSLFIVSIISIVFVVSLNYFVSRHKYKPYSEYTNKEWASYVINNGLRHLVNFNLIIYFLEKYFDKILLLKIFVIGSSIFSYFITYLKVMRGDMLGNVNYSYEMFAAGEPILHGLTLVISVFLYIKLFGCKFNIYYILIFISIGTILWYVISSNLKTYNYKTKEEWAVAASRFFLTGVVKSYILYYLLVNL